MLSPVTALWAFGCSIFSPSINHLYCCGVSSFCGTSSSVIQSALKFDAYFVHLQNSLLRNSERNSTIRPQEMDMAGRQASRMARTGWISVKHSKPKNITKVIISMRIRVNTLLSGAGRG